MSFHQNSLILQKLADLEENRDHSKYWNISKDLAEILTDLVQSKNPSKVLEIGTSNGLSTLAIVRGLNEKATITTIEVDESRAKEAKTNFSDCKLDNIELIKGEIFEILEEDRLKEPFDLIFIDAAHKKYKELVQKLEEKKLITQNSTIIADNVISHSYMDEFIQFMQSKFNTEIIEVDSGFLVSSGSK